MINSEIYLKNITSALANLCKQVEISNCISFYDINIIAEDFYANLLNIIFDYELININNYEKGVTGIDLGDEKARISVQVTSNNGSEKIKETINKFIEKNYYLKYDRLIILILTKKKNYTTLFDTKSKFIFNKKNDIIDYLDLMRKIKEYPIEKLKVINKFLDDELVLKLNDVKTTQASEVDTIIDLIEIITKNREIKERLEVVIDPEYKIKKRFSEFADKLINDYQNLYTIYGNTLDLINSTLDIDEAQELITMYYLQDISIAILDKTKNDPIKAIDELVKFFEEKLSLNGKNYDRAAIKFYLINEVLKCNVFPNERLEYNND